MELVLLFPGQGSQKPGMARDLVEAVPAARKVFDAADAALGTKLSALCFDGPAEELTLTHQAQPALLTHGAAAWEAIRDLAAPHVRAAAGHSLGEFSAYHAAGAITLEGAVKLVRRRGELMYETGVRRPGTMAAILGATTSPIEELCTRASEAGLCVPANYNDAAQVVVSGEVPGVERCMELAKEAGARRAVRLNVSGAFHSPLMEPAVEGLGEALRGAALREPAFPVWSNVTAGPCSSASEAESLLLRQLTSPVRWAQEMTAMVAAYPKALFVELGPGNVLTGLLKRIAPEARGVTCGTAAEVESLRQQLQ